MCLCALAPRSGTQRGGLISLLYFLLIYISGLALYSSLFIDSANQDPMHQVLKVSIAALHCLILILPVYLAQQRPLLVRAIGYGLILVYFIYAIFLVGFFSYFGFVPEIYAYGGGNLADMSKVIDHYFAQVFGLREAVLLVTFAALLYLIPRRRLPSYALVSLLIPLSLFGTSIFQFGAPSESEKFGNVTVMRRFGILGFAQTSIGEILKFENGYIAPETPFPGRIADLVHPDSLDYGPSAFAHLPPDISRVFLIQIESFDPGALGAKLSGRSVMPFVSALKSRCLNYTNFFTTKGAGGSSDAEFAVATGLVPSLRAPSLRHFNFTETETLYEALSRAGVKARYAHNNHAGFYGRNVAYQRMDGVVADFERPNSKIDEQTFAAKALARSLEESSKSFHYFFNFKSHGPYRGYSDETREKFSLGLSPDLKSNYLATMNEVDQMVENLFSLQLEGFNRGYNLFILTADHPSYVLNGGKLLENFRVPALICHTSFEGQEIGRVFGTMDLYPTILQAFGLSKDKKFLGQSMLLNKKNAVLLPTGFLVYLDTDGSAVADQCGEACRSYFDYTDQHILLAP